jgi:hypothetical protein
MPNCDKCGKHGEMHFYEQYFFCREHWREAYELAFDAQKKATRHAIMNYIGYKTQEDIDDAANLFKDNK